MSNSNNTRTMILALLASVAAFVVIANRKTIFVDAIEVVVNEEKAVFLRDPLVVKRLSEKGITLKVKVVPAHELHLHPIKDHPVDAIWFDSQMDYETYPGEALGKQAICHSPVVMVMHHQTFEALKAKGFVFQSGDRSWFRNGVKFMELVTKGRDWSNLGLSYYGPVKIEAGDPHRSSVAKFGLLWAAQMVNGGNALAEATEGQAVELLQPVYKEGLRQGSSLELFNAFIANSGQHPIIMVDEHMVIEQSGKRRLPSTLRMVYPNPTVDSSHVAVGYTKDGMRLVDALMDPQIQKILWEQHGCRPFSDTLNVNLESLAKLPNLKVAKTVSNVMPPPNAGVFEKFIDDVVEHEH